MVRSVQPNARATGLLVALRMTSRRLSARGVSRDMSANHVQFALQAARHFMLRDRPLNRLKKFTR
jgi:hypothetical protein